jgi:hypothetical protein
MLSRSQDHRAAGRIRSIEKFNDFIKYRTRNLRDRSIVPEPTTLPRGLNVKSIFVEVPYYRIFSTLLIGPFSASMFSSVPCYKYTFPIFLYFVPLYSESGLCSPPPQKKSSRLGQDFSPFPVVQTFSGAHPPSYPMCTGGLLVFRKVFYGPGALPTQKELKKSARNLGNRFFHLILVLEKCRGIRQPVAEPSQRIVECRTNGKFYACIIEAILIGICLLTIPIESCINNWHRVKRMDTLKCSALHCTVLCPTKQTPLLPLLIIGL